MNPWLSVYAIDKENGAVTVYCGLCVCERDIPWPYSLKGSGVHSTQEAVSTPNFLLYMSSSEHTQVSTTHK